MSASFRWELIKPEKARSFSHGTSSDMDALKRTFGDQIHASQIPLLRAMHAATHQKESLWQDIADTLERLRGDDYDKEVKIRVWVEF